MKTHGVRFKAQDCRYVVKLHTRMRSSGPHILFFFCNLVLTAQLRTAYRVGAFVCSLRFQPWGLLQHGTFTYCLRRAHEKVMSVHLPVVSCPKRTDFDLFCGAGRGE
jgi:hypothetical protein